MKSGVMKELMRPGGLSRRASLVGALGVAAMLTAAATPPPASSATHTTKPAAQPSNGSLFLLGDSWGAGLHADPTKALGQVAAGILSMTADVDAVSGTGYVNTAGQENYLERAKQATGSPRLVVVQGGSNDQHEDMDDVAANARATFQVLGQRFPHASLLVLGPGPDPAPVTAQQRAVDTTLQSVARSLGIRYASMLQHDWIPTTHVDSVIDPATAHPTVQGQAYLGTRLAASVRLLFPELVA